MGIRTVNIVGRGMGMELAPEKGCWGINSVIFNRNVDLLFDMHQSGQMKEKQLERRKKIIEVTNETKTPVYSCEQIDGTTYIRYPIEEVINEFKTGYFSNGVCYMIALAILQGATEINFYGVNHSRMNFLDEYTLQKPGVDYWLGICLGRGVKYNIHGVMSEIGRTFNNHCYGYFLSQEGIVKKYTNKNFIGLDPNTSMQ